MKLPALELAILKLGIGQAPSSTQLTSGQGASFQGAGASYPSSGMVAGPPPAVGTPGTSIILGVIKGTNSLESWIKLENKIHIVTLTTHRIYPSDRHKFLTIVDLF
jgi:hypothetical protein